MNDTDYIIACWIILVAIIIIITIILFVVYIPKNLTVVPYNETQIFIDEDELDTVVDFPLYNQVNNTLRMAVLVTPATQPPLNPEARKHIGFHITSFPSQDMPANYDLVEVMKGFNTTNINWNLTRPGITTKLKKATSKNLLLMMIYGATTLDDLKKYLVTKGWKNPWMSNHVTLGYLDPLDVADPKFFINQQSWYVQLVINSGPANQRGWPASQRILLNVAAGKNN